MKKYKQSPIYYTGNKFRNLKNIEPLFPKNINVFHDVFGGSGTVALNVNANIINYNDLDFTYGLMKTLINREPEQELKRVVDKAKEFNFPEKSTWKDNTKGVEFLKFKKQFYDSVPEKITKKDYDDILFWMHYSFSNKIEFKQNGNYDLSCGARLLKPKLYLKKLNNLKEIKHKLNIFNLDYLNYLKQVKNYKKEDFFYFDPPYLSSDRVKYIGWNETNEIELLKILDMFIKHDIKFGLSNSIYLRKNKNQILIDWIEKNKNKIYVKYITDLKYTISNADITTNLGNKNIEVYITNLKKKVENE